MLLDTCFLIDLQKELKRKEPGAAHAFLANWRGDYLGYSLITRMEFLEGYADSGLGIADRFLRPYKCLFPDLETAWRTSRIEWALRAGGNPIGDHDAWIAATALQHRLTLLTRNRNHFERIPGLPIAGY
jgi:tRNA(fMet)-specific endonuclease VapC